MKFNFLVAIILFSTSTFAQLSKVSGNLTNADSKSGLEYATITFRNTNDTSSVRGTKTNINGTFAISDLPYGTYIVAASSIGFTTVRLKSVVIDREEVKLDNIALKPNSKSLKDVLVKGEKESVELSIDKKTFNVDKNITAAGGTAADILRNVPSVNVDMDGNLSVRGKENVTLLVDGKPSSMFGNDPQTALTTLPASSIESIEVITNPSSKYEAQGMNGIVNIILKKDRKPGYNGMLTLGAASPFRFNAGLNFNANIKKWNLFANANFRKSETWEETTSFRDNYDTTFRNQSFTHNDRKPRNGFINIGADFSPNKNNKFTLSQNIYNGNMKGDSRTDIMNYLDTSIVNRQVRTNLYTGKPLSLTTNFQYKHIFKDPKEELNVEANYSKTRYIRSSSIQTDLFDSNSIYQNSYTQRNPIHGGNWNGTFQVDYTKPLFKKGRIDIGEKTYYIQFKSENQPTIQYANQSEYPETILKNHFVFTQQVHGIYTNLANQFGKTGVQVGLRAEYFTYEGTVYQINSKVNNSYFNLFPTFFVNHKLTSTSEVNFNYSKRVNRPNFFQLVPYIDVTNPQDTSQGNPNLKPEFIHTFELTYNYQYGNGNNLLASVYYQHTNNLIQRYRRFNENGTTYSQNRNLATGVTAGIDITNKINLIKWADATINVNIFKNHVDGSNVDATLQQNGFGGFGKLIANAKLKYGFSTQITANYFATTAVAQGYVQPYGNLDIALKKSLFKNLATLTLNVSDLFNTNQTKTIYQLYPYYDQSVLRKNQTRSIGLNLQVRFASKSQRANPEQFKRPPSKKEKEKEAKSRDENLKKDEGDDNNGPGGGRENNK